MTDTDVLSDDPAVVDGAAGEPPAEVELDAVAASAVALAKEAAETEAAGLVGEHLGVEPDGPGVVVHYFATLDPAYVGWRWAVSLARAPRSKTPTVDDVVLLPGSAALLAPEWLPWSDRLRPGDLGVGDLLPTAADDRRLIPAYFASDDEQEAAVAFELGLGRERLLSYDGQQDAVDRWYAGEPGPRADVARTAPASCATCGFYIPLSGGLRQAFGACANEYAPDDGKVVAVDHGCGAHSEAVIVPVSPPPPPPLIDEAGYDIVEPPAATPVDEVSPDDAAASSTGDDLAVTPAEGGAQAVEAE